MLPQVEALRTRLEEKENTIVRKETLLSTLSSDKSKRSTETIELREMLDIKDRKINVLQRKVGGKKPKRAMFLNQDE